MRIHKIQSYLGPHSILDWIKSTGDDGYPVKNLDFNAIQEAEKLERGGFVFRKKTGEGEVFVINPLKLTQHGLDTRDSGGMEHKPKFFDPPANLNLQERWGWLDGANGEKANPPQNLTKTQIDGEVVSTDIRAKEYMRGYELGKQHAGKSP